MKTPLAENIPTETARDEFPPGVSAGIVAEPFRLSNAHSKALEENSYTVTETRKLSYPNGSTRYRERDTVEVAKAGNVYLYTTTRSGAQGTYFDAPNGTSVYYSNGSAVARRIEYPNQPPQVSAMRKADRSLLSPHAVYHGTPVNAERIAVLFESFNGSVSEDRDTRSVFHYRSHEFTGESVEVGGTRVTDVSSVEFTATIGSDGFVHEYHLAFQGTMDGRRIDWDEHVVYSDIGSTTVKSPPWLPERVDSDRRS